MKCFNVYVLDEATDSQYLSFSETICQIIAKMAATLEAYLHRMVSIITADGRNFVGTLKGFDQTVNLVLDDTHERVFSSSNGVEQVFLI